MLPGGKGINVSTVLMNLGIENTALGFTAGFVGEEIIRRLQEMGVKSEFIQISEGVSRINLKLKSIDGTEINGAGPVISKDKVEELMKKLDEGMKGTMADYQIASVAETAIMDVYPYSAEERTIDSIGENANSPVVRNFIQSLPEGCKTTITVGGKQVVVDKTGKDTVVTPQDKESDDIRGDD